MEFVTMQELSDIENFIKLLMDQWEVPCLAVGLTHEGKSIYSSGFGYSDIENKERITSDTLFCIGSVTKSFTAFAIGLLVERGLLGWDQKVKKIIPEFELKDINASNDLSIRDFLAHRTGVFSYDELLYTRVIKNRKDILNFTKYFEQEYPIRKKYSYNNYMYALLGHIIEKITNVSWEEYVTENIFKPLGMENTYASIKQCPPHKLVKSYYRENKTNTIIKSIKQCQSYEFLNPAGGIYSCIRDMQKWSNVFNSENITHNLLSKEIVKEILSPQILISEMANSKEFSTHSYGFGWHLLEYKGLDLIRHGGNVDDFSSEISIIPSKNLGIVILGNLGNVPIGQILSMYVYDLIFKNDITDWNSRFYNSFKKNLENELKANSTEKQDIIETPLPNNLPDYLGVYHNELYGELIISNKADKLFIQIKNEEYLLHHHQQNVFSFYGYAQMKKEIKYGLESEGKIEFLHLQISDKIEVKFLKVK